MSHAQRERPWLLCLDLSREAVGRKLALAEARGVPERLRAVLETTRAADWEITHVIGRPSAAPHDEDLNALRPFYSALQGLQPLTDEPVWTRVGLSAFSVPAAAARLRQRSTAEIYLAGDVFTPAGLATVLATVEARKTPIIVEDACFPPSADWPNPAQFKTPRAIFAPLACFELSARLAARSAPNVVTLNTAVSG